MKSRLMSPSPRCPAKENALVQYCAMNVEAILIELRDHPNRLQHAIDALERATRTGAAAKRRGRKPRRHMSAEARAKIAAAQRTRWAAQKRAS